METDTQSPAFNREVESGRFLTAVIVTGLLGIASFLVLPSLVLGFVTDLGFSELQVGRISTFQLIGLGLGSVASVLLLKYLDWRNLSRFGLALLLVSDFACTLSGEFTPLLVLRFISGFAGGVCVSFAAYGLGLTANTDRNFGWFMTVQVGFAIIASFSFPSVLDLAGLDGIFYVLCLLELASIALVSGFMPAVRRESASREQGNDRVRWTLCALVMVGLLFFFTALGMFWTYIAPIGLDAGLSKQQTGNAVSVALFGALLGAYAAAALNIRIGRLLPLTLSLALQLVALLLLYQGLDYLMFCLAAALFGFGWYMYVPYQFALLAGFDRDGRPMLLLNAVAGLGSGLGPAIAAYLLADGYSLLYILCALFLALSLAWHLAAIGLGKRRL
ncbi:MAG: hypothetical protein OXS28_03265 [Gammaproteobacteria bacterium]|nr:hypothetical protein [Gammaproteobacteria bacterium]MDE0284640.1 hypothetical protein [Gammaproteobacteria bacterium]